MTRADGRIERLLDLKVGGLEFDRLVELVHRHLRFELVFVVELVAGGAVCRSSAGIDHAMLSSVGAPVSRALAAAVRRVSAERQVGELGAGPPEGPGRLIGVPLRLSDGTNWGALCALSSDSDRVVGQREVEFMSMLSDLVVDELDRRNDEQRAREDIHALIDSERVAVAYQPIFDLCSKRCLGVEALARFPEPFPSPDRTFAVAERLGLGLQLEELVVRQAWEVLPLLAEGQFLALNLTPQSLLQLARRAYERHDVPLNSVVVEVTEHTAIDAYSDLRFELERLRVRGLRLAVDDAGAGFASLRHVLELRPDILKIDRSLIDGLSRDFARRIAVQSFVAMAENLQAIVVAEGVERRADRDAAQELGLHAAQGYLFGRPSTDRQQLLRWISRPPRSTRRGGPARARARGPAKRPAAARLVG